MKKLLSLVLVLTIAFSMLLVTDVNAEGGVIASNFIDEFEAGTGGAALSFYNRNFHPLTGDKFTVAEAIGVDGTPVASFKVQSNNSADYNNLIMSDPMSVKAGYTYFKSVMMRMNPDNTDDNKENSYYIWSNASGSGVGFASKADSAEVFNSAKSAWESSENKNLLAGYNNLGTNTTSPSYTLSTSWQRVTEAEYRDASDAGNASYRWGWGVWRSSTNWSNAYGSTGNYQIDMDDYVIIEVPNNNIKSVAYPVVSLATATINGSKIEASYQAYDVNPLVDNTSSVVWQKFEGGKWADFSDGESIILSTSYRGAKFRAKITSTSVPYNGDVAMGAISAVKYTNEIAVPYTYDETGSVITADFMGDDISSELLFRDMIYLNPITSTSNVSVVESVGPDGSLAAGYNVKQQYIQTGIPVLSGMIQKRGYTYFKSAMMRMNPDKTDSSKLINHDIYNFTENKNIGFISTGNDFETELAEFVSAETKPAMVSDKLGTDSKSIHHKLSTDWTRVTEALYFDSSSTTENSSNRWGWFFTGCGSWGNYSTGNFQIDVDDFVIIEVPNTELKSVVYPMIDSAKAICENEVVKASAEIYDINPLVTPGATYQWQVKNGEAWEDIEGATSASFDADGGKIYRAKVQSVSTPEYSDGTVLASVSSVVKYTNEITVPCALSFNEFENATVSVNGNAVESGAKVNVEAGSLTIKVTPTAGYTAGSVKVDGIDYTLNSDGEAIVTISGSCVVEVAITSVAPSVSVATLGTPGTREENGKLYVTNIAYAKFVNIIPDWYGMIITDTVNPINSLKLEGKNHANGSFGIRVYGDALDGTYSLKPLITYTENSEEKQLENTGVEFTVVK